MTDQDRGAYTPQTDAPLSFDARYARGSGERPMPMMLIVSGVVLVVLVIALIFFYRSGVRGLGQAPRVVGSTVVETRSPPSAQSEAAADSAAGLTVLKGEATPNGEMRPPVSLAPAAEEPVARPAPVAKPVEKAQLRVAPQTPAATPRSSGPQTIEQALDQANTPPPAAKPVKLAAETTPKPTPVAAPATGGATGAAVVQIGAFSSAALAEKGWSDTAAVIPGQMAGKTKKVEVASRDGKTFYRTYVGGFDSKADAQAFCASLKAAGKGCIIR